MLRDLMKFTSNCTNYICNVRYGILGDVAPLLQQLDHPVNELRINDAQKFKWLSLTMGL